MKIYLSNPYGTIPGEDWREYRFFLLGKILASHGHEVIWFTSTFSHHFKTIRSKNSKKIKILENFHIHLIKSTSYKKNISIGRVLKDISYGFNFLKTVNREYSKPDFFINGDSPILFYFPSYFYCKKNNIPYLLDQMDLWPELIINSLPNYIKNLAFFLCYPVFKNRINVYNNCVGFFSLAQKYLEIPIKIAPELLTKPHDVIYNGIDVGEFKANMNKENIFINEVLPIKQESEIWFIFAGTLGPSYDIKTIMQGICNLQNCKLIIAGDGSEREYIQKFISNSKSNNIIYIGRISKETLPYLYSKCDVGLNAYGPYSNVEMSDKFYDYTAAGLVVLNSLTGEVKTLVEKYKIGFNYKSNNLESFISCASVIIKNNDQLVEMKNNSTKLGILFDQSNQMEKFSNLFNKLLK